jgi:hypothetical protein
MKSDALIQRYESFQPEIQKEILDFIGYLEMKYKVPKATSIKNKSWKQKFTPIKLKGKLTAQQILREERDST